MARAKRAESLGGRLERVRLADVGVDESYQRGLKSHAKYIAKNLNRNAVGVMHVAQRGTKKLWLDGQQRSWALQQNGIESWMCVVIESPGPQYEAHVYRLLNDKRGRRSLNANELFKSAVAEQDPTALAVVRAAESAGLRIKTSKGGSRGWPEIACVGLLHRNACQAGGEALVGRVLNLIAKTWPGVHDALHESLVGGVWRLLAERGEMIEEERFVQNLRATTPMSIILNSNPVSGGMSRYVACGEEILRLYNKKLRGGKKLPPLRVAPGTVPNTSPEADKGRETA